MNLAFKLAQADAAGLKRLPGSLHVNRRLDQWLRWQGRSAEDGRLLVFSGKVDIGQGLSTALAQIVAEELQLALWQVQMQPACTGVSPDEAVTSGSLSIQESGTALRWACAEVRALYLAAAARRWGLPDDAATLASLQVHEGRIAAPAGLGNVSKLALAPLCYWQLAADPDFIDLLDREASGEVAPRAVSAHVLVGQSLPRQDLPAKLLGQGGFVHDLRLPQMLFARVLRAPSPGARLLALNAEAMLQRLSPAQRQQVAVVQDGQFVAVVAEQEALAVRARSLLQSAMQWQEQATLPDEHAMDEFLLSQTPERLDSSIVAQRQPEASTKSLQPATPTPAIALQAQYSRPYIAHASIGPSCAIAQWQPLPEETPGASATHALARQVTLWSHSQGPYNLRTDLALTLGLTPEQVVVQHCEGAGCYGHNGADDVALDAALAARDLPAHWRGRPVQLQWMREDESAWEPFGPAAVVQLQAAVTGDGRIIDWQHAIWSNGHSMRPGRAKTPTLLAAADLAQPFARIPAINAALAAGGGAERNAIPGYDFPAWDIRCNRLLDMPIRTSAMRALGGFINVFAIECFMDELALACKQDPLAFRLAHVSDARARAVIEAAAQRADWHGWKQHQARSATEADVMRGHGLAWARYKNSGAWCAVVAEVEAGATLRVTRLVIALDCGLAINPDGIRNQIEGGAIQATSWTLKEQVRFDRQRITSIDWESYPILRFEEVPAVEIELINRPDELPLGAGEAAQGPTAAAIGNALHDALGLRMRALPLSDERITQALLAQTS